MTPADLRKLADDADTWKPKEGDIFGSVMSATFIVAGCTMALRQAADEIERLRLALEIIAGDPWPCTGALQNTAQRALDGEFPCLASPT